MLREAGLKEALAAFSDGKDVVVLDMANKKVTDLADALGDMRFLVSGTFKAPEIIRTPEDDTPFDYGKLKALVNAGKDLNFLQVEFGCTRAQIAARIRVLKKMQEESDEG